MADTWHGYIVIERNTLGDGNWDALVAVFDNMGNLTGSFPQYCTQKRASLDGNAVIYESAFNPSEVSVDEFKQFLADEFSVDVADIEDTQSVVSYGDYDTAVWVFAYPISGDDRFTVRRFGRGETWGISRNECIGYLSANIEDWENPLP